MLALVCIDGRSWEAVIQGVAQYLSEGEAILAHVVDERASRGYEGALWGLLGRRDRRLDERMLAVSQEAAEDLLADAAALIERLRPDLTIKTVVLRGLPNEELMRAAREAEIIFISRGTPRAHSQARVSGIVRDWRKNLHGDTDGLTLEEGIEIRFPPHKAGEIQAVIGEGGQVEALGVWRAHHLHAHTIVDSASGTSIEAHKPTGQGAVKSPLGHTARFVVDHALCDVVVLYP